jgi:Icc-related predicted phosphoesterase
MNITFISDTHNMHDQITMLLPGGDVIVHCGDFTRRGYIQETQSFLKWYDALPYTHKIFIAGNHDFCFESQKADTQDILKEYPSLIYLEDSEVVIDGVKFYGSPHTPRFFDWAFNVDRGEKIREHWLKIPVDADVVITHGPVHGILDKTHRDRKHVGCEDLLDVLNSQVQPKIHACGHIHEGFGIHTTEQTIFINASTVNHFYLAANYPVQVEI